MDDLDRLYLELVESLRGHGKGLGETVRVREMHEELIPYRRVRDRVGFRSNGEYQVALSRLLSGERGYLKADAALQESVREALFAPVPDARRFRAFPDAEVRLEPGAVPPPSDTRYAPPEVRKRAARLWSEMGPKPASAPEAGEVRGGVEGSRESSRSTASSAPPVEGEAGDEEDSVVERDAGKADGEPALSGGDPESPDPETVRAHGGGAGGPQDARVPMERSICPGCGDDLPDRPIRYCPYCGHGPIEARCAACRTPLRRDWKYCPECGRSRDFGRSNSA